MTLLTDAQVAITLADFANADAQGKINVVGAGIRLLGFDPNTGACPPFFLMVNIALPDRYGGTSFALTIELRDVTTGQHFQLPGPTGALEPLRAQQVVPVPHLQVPAQFGQPDDAVVSMNVIMGFPNGLPLQPGHGFEWRIEIDGQSRHWTYKFHILGPAPGPVFGGPVGSPNIPGVGQYVVDPPEDQSEEPPAG